MIERARFALLALAHACLFLLWMVSPATADCGYFKPLDDLAAEMRSVATGQALTGTETAQRVALNVRNVHLGEVRRQLEIINQSAQYHHVEQLVIAAADYLRTRRTPDRAALTRNVRNVERLLKVVCNSRIDDASIVPGLGAGRKDYATSILESHGNAFELGLLPLLLAATVGLLVSFKYVLAYTSGFFHNRTICRVQALLRGNGQDFPGIVTRAGLNGVRFEFECDSTAKRLTDLLATPGFVYFDLWIDNDDWPVFVDGFHKFFSPLYFLTRLKRSELAGILEHSTRALQIAPEIGPKTTRRMWRAQIKQRKANIASAKHQRAVSG